ncbi:hypothetical protein [Staphylococcus epidermidis]|nr:hypothetical protein [Staphylococcus epidermidis]MBC2998677.1 hypothetical protein [Staphylococcus epidermidis]MCD8869010.1 hypothetical protein [Staphylococcus epidermidis]MCG1225150.1 hypothetical protein [Staphylococcus epidermidis]MCG1304792.1 hypothetical protein [Staphylococcus epidermidis]MCG1796954.1 hypothetical protein [Staphylococcus epidermidis]
MKPSSDSIEGYVNLYCLEQTLWKSFVEPTTCDGLRIDYEAIYDDIN